MYKKRKNHAKPKWETSQVDSIRVARCSLFEQIKKPGEKLILKDEFSIMLLIKATDAYWCKTQKWWNA